MVGFIPREAIQTKIKEGREKDEKEGTKKERKTCKEMLKKEDGRNYGRRKNQHHGTKDRKHKSHFSLLSTSVLLD